MDSLAVKAEPLSGHRVDLNAILSPGNAIEELKAQDPPRSNIKRDLNKATSLGSSGNAKYQAIENTSTEDSNHEVSRQPSFNTSSTRRTQPPKHEFPDHVEIAGSQKVPVRKESVVSKSQRKARNVANTSKICRIGIESERKTGNLGLLTRSVMALLFNLLLILAAFGIVSGITQRPHHQHTAFGHNLQPLLLLRLHPLILAWSRLAASNFQSKLERSQHDVRLVHSWRLHTALGYAPK